MGKRASVPAAIWGEQLRVLLLAVPVAILLALLLGFLGSFSDNPGRVVAALVALGLLSWRLGWSLYREQRLALGGGYVLFLFVYTALFSGLASSQLLDGRRTTLAGYDDRVPRSLLGQGLGWLGDWRYDLLPRIPVTRLQHHLVVLLPRPTGSDLFETSRLFRSQVIQLLTAAEDQGASAIAFDLYFRQEPYRSEYEQALKDVDAVLCRQIENLPGELDVAFGYVHRRQSAGGEVERYPIPESLSDCGRARWVSLVGYREADCRVRMIPLYFRGLETERGEQERVTSMALSGWLARRLRGAPVEREPASGLLQFAEPQGGVRTEAWEGREEEVAELFNERVVLVGWTDANQPAPPRSPPPGQDGERSCPSSGHDVHDTPFGPLRGVEIHAYGALSLAMGHYIWRLPPWSLFLFIFVLSSALALVQGAGGGARWLLVAGLALTVAWVAAAALAIRLALLWIDVAYPVLATWVLVPVLLGGAKLQAVRVRAVRAALAPAAAEGAAGEVAHFHVFLSYNSVHRPEVIALAEALQDRRLQPWLDVWEIRPGDSWLQALEEVIETVGSAAVLVGKDAPGPWVQEEMNGCLQQCKKRGMQVIPVLLPSAPESPDLPLFLSGRTWVDLRDGLTEENLDQLEWGVTGIKPRRPRRA